MKHEGGGVGKAHHPPNPRHICPSKDFIIYMVCPFYGVLASMSTTTTTFYFAPFLHSLTFKLTREYTTIRWLGTRNNYNELI